VKLKSAPMSVSFGGAFSDIYHIIWPLGEEECVLYVTQNLTNYHHMFLLVFLLTPYYPKYCFALLVAASLKYTSTLKLWNFELT